MLKINWQKLVLNLRREIRTDQIAKETGLSVSCINNIAAGNVTNPMFSTGIYLLNLHLDHCADKHKSLYTERA